ncbi:MAG: hypothetical protein JXJ22_06140 [Bacteroidales bacterium]|nr:hypothetical protein [Bacteroidales bacterium]
MRNNFFRRPYPIVNFIFTGIILLIFIYSGIFSAEKGNHPIPSMYKEISGNKTISTGLSRAFSSIVTGKSELAKEYNPYSIRIFLFFAVQLVLRILFVIMENKLLWSRKILIISDIFISVLLFLYCFWPFIQYPFTKT